MCCTFGSARVVSSFVTCWRSNRGVPSPDSNANKSSVELASSLRAASLNAAASWKWSPISSKPRFVKTGMRSPIMPVSLSARIRRYVAFSGFSMMFLHSLPSTLRADARAGTVLRQVVHTIRIAWSFREVQKGQFQFSDVVWDRRMAALAGSPNWSF